MAGCAQACSVVHGKTMEEIEKTDDMGKSYLADRASKSNSHLLHDLNTQLHDKEEYRAYLRMDTGSFVVGMN